MSSLFWILFSLLALVAAWHVILMSATFPLPQPPADEPPAPEAQTQRPETISPFQSPDTML